MASTQEEASNETVQPANKLFLETSMPTSASPYPSPSSAFYPPPIPASHEFANKIANNKRFRGGVSTLVTGGISPSTTANSASALGIDSVLSAASEPGSRRTSDAFLGTSANSSRRGSAVAGGDKSPVGGSTPGSRRQSRDANAGHMEGLNGTSSKRQSANPDSIPETKEETPKPEPSQDASTASTTTERPPSIPNPTSLPEGPTDPSPSEEPPASTPTLEEQTASPLSKRISLTPIPLTPSRPAPPSPAPSRRPSLARRGSSRYSNTSRDQGSSRDTTEKLEGKEGKTDKTTRRQSNLSMSFTYLTGEGSHAEEPEEDVNKDRPPLVDVERDEPKLSAEDTLVLDTKSPMEGKSPGDDSGISQETDTTIDAIPVDEDGRLITEPDTMEDVEGEGVVNKPILVRDFAYPEEDERFAKVPLELLSRSQRERDGQPLVEGEEEEWDDTDDWQYAGDSTPLTGSRQNSTEEGEGEGEEVLKPGIYRALYSFEAEGTAEMSLVEGMMVKVVGSGGVGWAVVERDWKGDEDSNTRVSSGSDGGGDGEGRMEGVVDSGSGALGLAGQALVPESYLEVWELDEWREG